MNYSTRFILAALFPAMALVAENNQNFSLFSLDNDEEAFVESIEAFEKDLEAKANEKVEKILASPSEPVADQNLLPSPIESPKESNKEPVSPEKIADISEEKKPVVSTKEVEKDPLASLFEQDENKSALVEKAANLDVVPSRAIDEPAKEVPSFAIQQASLKEEKKERVNLPATLLPISNTAKISTPSEEVAWIDEENDELPSYLDLGDQKSNKSQVASVPLLTLETEEKSSTLEINLRQVFSGSPLIYSILFFMSMIAVFIWLYNLLSLKYAGKLPETILKPLRMKLNSNQYDDALSMCMEHDNLFCRMIATGIHSRRYGMQVMLDAMKAEGKRASMGFWQRMGLLNDIAIIAPMLGLLGTVLGMFYAFYDVNRTTESVTTLFDGLGISVGTTVAGLVVAILSMILHSTAKYRIVRQLARIENEAYSLASLIDSKAPIGGNS